MNLTQGLIKSILSVVGKNQEQGPWSDAGSGFEKLHTRLNLAQDLNQQIDLVINLATSFDIYPKCLWRPKNNSPWHFALGSLAQWNTLQEFEALGMPDMAVYMAMRFEAQSRKEKLLHQEWQYLGEQGNWWLPLVEVIIHDDALELTLYRKQGEQYKGDELFAAFQLPQAPMTDVPNSVYSESIPDRAAWKKEFEQLMPYLQKDLSKIVWARYNDLTLQSSLRAEDVLQHLLHASAEHFSLWHAPHAKQSFLSHTPEKLFKRTNRLVEVDSIAGTRPRSTDNNEDFSLAQELFQSSKERREQQIVTDQLVDNLKSVSVKVEVPPTPTVLRLKNVQHLASTIRAKLNDGVSDAALIGLLHPTAALGGHPRVMAVELIDQYAQFNRGNYGAPFGRFTRQESEVAVAIRSVLHADNRILAFAGCGLVNGSDQDAEWNETSLKMRPMLTHFLPTTVIAPPNESCSGNTLYQ